MTRLGKRETAWLQETFADRVNLSELERKMYSHDIAAMPSLFKPLVGKTVPDAVVQPESEEELAALVRWASENRIPLTPRGKATSGYGGVLPVKRGIVVDFYRLRKVKSIDKETLTATVEPGIVFEELDRALAREDLTSRLYPSSYPSATVGGWLAQGGAGFGSFEYGWFPDNVVSARIVLPSGEVREMLGDDLSLVADAEGITGIISEVTLKVMPNDTLETIAVGCSSALDVQKLSEKIIEQDLPVWSLVFINPRMAEMKNRAPLQTHLGHPVEERVMLPASYILSVSFRGPDREKIAPALKDLTESIQAEILSERIARHEWENRFKLMIVKRLGPSLVPSEVVVPLTTLGDTMEEIEETIDQPIVKEAVILKNGREGKPEAVILGFIPADERTFSYNLVFSLSLSVMKIAQRHGGRPYATGFYFGSMADRILGRERVQRLRTFKEQVDPKDILNPGKVLGSGIVSKALDMAWKLEPLSRPIANAVITRTGERPTEPVRGIPEDVAWYAYACSGCGYCIDSCDQFYGRGWESQTPRGKWWWLREYMEGREDWSQFMVDTMLVCTTCEICNNRCSAALPIEPSWMKIRGRIIHEEKKMTFPPFEMMSAALADQGNIWAGYRKNRAAWFPEDLLDRHGPGVKSKNVYFAGCTASYVEHDIAQASVRLLDEAGVDFTYVGEPENCCATPMLVAGKWDLFVEVMKENIENVKKTGADTVISSCPACDMMWRNTYPEWCEKLGIEYDLKAVHYSEVLSEKIKAGEFSFPENGKEKEKVCWHDSCHIGRVSKVYEEPRELIKAVPHADFVEMAHNREDGHCCGSVLTLIKEPDVAADIGEIRLQDALDIDAKKVLALCPCCEFQLRVTVDKKNLPLEVVDLAHYAANALGHEFPDPNPEVRAQWAVFEAMIKLMTPEGFADLMGTMWKELVDAMPYKMGPMMRVMGKIPGALNLMKPMFPILFPILLPMMMPKVMPTMLSRVADRVPMPDYMAEQMPELMPKVMDNLMPHMIHDVVPLVVDPMVAYLQGRG